MLPSLLLHGLRLLFIVSAYFFRHVFISFILFLCLFFFFVTWLGHGVERGWWPGGEGDSRAGEGGWGEGEGEAGQERGGGGQTGENGGDEGERGVEKVG